MSSVSLQWREGGREGEEGLVGESHISTIRRLCGRGGSKGGAEGEGSVRISLHGGSVIGRGEVGRGK